MKKLTSELIYSDALPITSEQVQTANTHVNVSDLIPVFASIYVLVTKQSVSVDGQSCVLSDE